MSLDTLVRFNIAELWVNEWMEKLIEERSNLQNNNKLNSIYF